MKRKFLSVLLALSMALTLTPAAAWADELSAETVTQETPTDNPDGTQEDEQAPEKNALVEEQGADVADAVETPADGTTADASGKTDAGEKADAEEAPDTEEEPAADAEEGDAEEDIAPLADVNEAAINVASIGETGYASLDAAIAAAKENDTIKLLDNVSVTEDAAWNNVTIETDGHTIRVADGATLTIGGSSTKITNNMANPAKNHQILMILGGGKLVINDGQYISNSPEVVKIWGTAEIKGGTFQCNIGDQNFTTYGVIAVSAMDGNTPTEGKLNMTGGKIIANDSATGTKKVDDLIHGLTMFWGADVTMGTEGGKDADGPSIEGQYLAFGVNNTMAPIKLTIHSGTYSCKVMDPKPDNKFSAVVYMSAKGEVTITGGTFQAAPVTEGADANDSTYIFSIPYQNVDIKLNVSGGTFHSAEGGKTIFMGTQNGTASGEPKVSITGGTFKEAYKTGDNVTGSYGEFIAAGYDCTQADGAENWTVGAQKLSVETTPEGTPVISGVYVDKDSAEEDDNVNATGNTVKFDAASENPTDEQKKEATVNIEPSTVDSLADAAEVKTVEIKTNAGTVTLDEAALNTLNTNAAAAITEGTDAKIELVVKQTAEEEKPAKADAAYEISLIVSGDSGKTSLLPAGEENGNITITVNFDYNGSLSEVFVYFVTGGVAQEQVGKAKVDKTAKTATFTVGHLSTYALSEDANLAAGKVAKIGTEYYGSLRAAVTAANGKSEAVVIELLQDVSITRCIDINKDITIKGNNVTVTAQKNEGEFTPSTDESHGSMAGDVVRGANSMLRVAGTAQDKAKLTLEGVTLDANGLCRGIFSGNDASLVINEGAKVTNGYAGDANYIGGVFIYGASELTMNGGEITGNKNGDEYSNDGFLQYASDLWIGNNATATLNGGKVGNMMVNATTNNAETGGKLIMPDGSTADVSTVFVEAGANHSGKVVDYAGGKIGTILLPLGYSDENDQNERPIASISNPENGTTVGNEGSFKIPDGATATIIQEGKLTNAVTIGEGATLVIPAGKTVTVVKPADGEVPAITNNGTLQVDGALIAGADDAATTTDGVYLNISGSGKIEAGAGATVDIDPEDTNITTLTFTFHLKDGTDNVIEKKVFVAVGEKANFSAIKPANPERSGYTFKGWFAAETGGTAIADDAQFEEDTEFYAQWDKKPKPRPDAGGSGGGASATTSTVTISSDGSSIKADVKISNGTATIGKVDDIKKVIGEDVVTIDASNLKKDVDTVKVDSSIVNAIANNEDSEGLEVKLSDGTVTFDADAVAGFKGGDLSVTWDKTNTNSLNSKQKDAVKDMDVQGSYKLTLNKALKNGEAEIRAAFAVPDGKDASDLALLRVGTDGTTKEVSARFSGGELRFTATESGDYVVVAKAGEQTTEPAEPTASAQNNTDFRDVDAGAWYGNAVNYVAANGLMSGVGDGLFAPNTNLSRAMLAQILYNHAGRPAADGASAFTDVPAGLWYTNAVAWATAQGVVSGYGSGLFGPNDNITREQLAVMLYRYAGSPAAEGSLGSFADAGKVSAYAQNALIWATTNGVMSGKGGGNLDPAGMATRAEVAQMLYNYLNR